MAPHRVRAVLIVLVSLAAPGVAACGGGPVPSRTASSSPSPTGVPGTRLPTAATSSGAATATDGTGNPRNAPSGTSGTGSPRDPGTAPATRPTAPSGRPTSLPAALRGRDWEVLDQGRGKVIALTFDAGADATGVAPILDTLRRTGTPGTFFLTGAFVDRHPAPARAIAARHRVGNHTATHPRLTGLDDGAVRAEVTGGADRIQAVTGADPRPWFRFPYGDRDARTIAAANAAGYAAVRWTVDSLGWTGTREGGQTAASVTARVLAAARPGGIVLLHVGANPDDGSTLDADALPGIIEGLHRLGYRLVDLDALRP